MESTPLSVPAEDDAPITLCFPAGPHAGLYCVGLDIRRPTAAATAFGRVLFAGAAAAATTAAVVTAAAAPARLPSGVVSEAGSAISTVTAEA
jgi:hypothetical protein